MSDRFYVGFDQSTRPNIVYLWAATKANEFKTPVPLTYKSRRPETLATTWKLSDAAKYDYAVTRGEDAQILHTWATSPLIRKLGKYVRPVSDDAKFVLLVAADASARERGSPSAEIQVIDHATTLTVTRSADGTPQVPGGRIPLDLQIELSNQRDSDHCAAWVRGQGLLLWDPPKPPTVGSAPASDPAQLDALKPTGNAGPNLPLIIGCAVALIALLGGAAWWFRRQSQSGTQPDPDEKLTIEREAPSYKRTWETLSRLLRKEGLGAEMDQIYAGALERSDLPISYQGELPEGVYFEAIGNLRENLRLALAPKKPIDPASLPEGVSVEEYEKLKAIEADGDNRLQRKWDERTAQLKTQLALAALFGVDGKKPQNDNAVLQKVRDRGLASDFNEVEALLSTLELQSKGQRSLKLKEALELLIQDLQRKESDTERQIGDRDDEIGALRVALDQLTVHYDVFLRKLEENLK